MPRTQNVLFQSEQHPLVSSQVQDFETHCLHIVHLKAYEAAAALAHGKRLLDVGCNDGYGTRVMADRGAQVVGVDVSRRAVDTARATHENLNFELVEGSVLPFADASFDVVTSFQVIEHVDDPATYLSELSRVLRPGGTALLTTPNRTIRLDPDMKPWNPFHMREYTGSQLGDQLSPFFATTRILGLYGKPIIAAMMLSRARRAKVRRREDRIRNAPELALWRIQGRLQRASSAVLERAGGERASRVLRSLATTADLRYEPDGDFKFALNLMAVCTK